MCFDPLIGLKSLCRSAAHFRKYLLSRLNRSETVDLQKPPFKFVIMVWIVKSIGYLTKEKFIKSRKNAILRDFCNEFLEYSSMRINRKHSSHLHSTKRITKKSLILCRAECRTWIKRASFWWCTKRILLSSSPPSRIVWLYLLKNEFYATF